MEEAEKLAYLQGFLLGMARRIETLPMLVVRVGNDPSSSAIGDVCDRAAKDCIAAAKIAGIADISDDGEGLDPEPA